MIVAIRAVILYCILLLAMRIMGKGDLGELQPFDLVVSLVLAELAVMPMEDLDAPLMHGFMATAVIVFLQCLISFIALKSNTVRKILNGTPSVIYDHGKFNIKDMSRLRININDILGQMRLKGYFNLKDVDYIIIETNGEVSIVAPESQNAKRIKRIPVTMILDGQIMYKNLEDYNITMDQLDRSLKKENLRYRDVLYGLIDEDDKFVFYER